MACDSRRIAEEKIRVDKNRNKNYRVDHGSNIEIKKMRREHTCKYVTDRFQKFQSIFFQRYITARHLAFRRTRRFYYDRISQIDIAQGNK